MKKKLMAVLTASSVAVMAAGATLAAYADFNPDKSDYVRDEQGNFEFTVSSGELLIQTDDGFEAWKEFGIPPELIKTVLFSSYVTAIPDNAFTELPNLETVSFNTGSGTNIEKIGENAFKDCTSLKNIYLPYNFADYSNDRPFVIGKSAFQGCTALMELSISPIVTEIGESAFEGCTSLGKTEEQHYGDYTQTIYHHVSFSGNLKIIGERAFYGCDNIVSVSLPSQLEIIGKRAFANCKSLFNVDMSLCKNLKTIDELAFFNCLSLKACVFPYNGTGAYFDPTNLPEDASNHTIKKWAFRNCPWLDGIILSTLVGTVEDEAFYNCNNLKYIGYHKIVADREDVNITVPSGLTEFSFEKLTEEVIIEMIGPEPDWQDKEAFDEWASLYTSLNGKYRLTIIKEATNEDGTPANPKIVIPEKIVSDADIYSVIETNGTERTIELPKIDHTYTITTESGYSYEAHGTYYDFSQLPEGYEMIPNSLLFGLYGGPTNRSGDDVENPKFIEGTSIDYVNSMVVYYSNSSGLTESEPNSDSESSDPESSTPESSVPTPPTQPTPPSYIPPPVNDDAPLESDPESSESESSEPESSEPESSESGSSEPGSSDPSSSKPNPSTPDSNPDDNPNTGVCFLAPIALVGAATVAVAARRRKMK